MPNPTVDKLNEGCERARNAKADLILSVGGGSCCDYSKAVSVSAYCNDDPWAKYFIRFEDVEARARSALEAQQWALHDHLDHESQKLCARLGY